MTNDSSVKETFKELEKYEKATGAKINIEKTEGLFIGKWETDMTSRLIVSGQTIK